MRSASIRNFRVQVAEEYDSSTLVKLLTILPTSFRLASLQDIEIAPAAWAKMPDSQLATPNGSVSAILMTSLFDAHNLESLSLQNMVLCFDDLTDSFMLVLATSCPKLQTVNLYGEEVDPQLTLPSRARFAQHLPCLQHLSKAFTVGSLTAEFPATRNNVKQRFVGSSKVSEELENIVAAYLSHHLAKL